MSDKNLTKIFCSPVDTKFLVLYLRFKGLKKEDLNLVAWNRSFKICDARIRADCIQKWEEQQTLKLSYSDFFNVNIVTAQCHRRKNEFSLKTCTFDEDKEVIHKFGTNWNQSFTKLVPIFHVIDLKQILDGALVM